MVDQVIEDIRPVGDDDIGVFKKDRGVEMGFILVRQDPAGAVEGEGIPYSGSLQGLRRSRDVFFVVIHPAQNVIARAEALGGFFHGEGYVDGRNRVRGL